MELQSTLALSSWTCAFFSFSSVAPVSWRSAEPYHSQTRVRTTINIIITYRLTRFNKTFLSILSHSEQQAFACAHSVECNTQDNYAEAMPTLIIKIKWGICSDMLFSVEIPPIYNNSAISHKWSQAFSLKAPSLNFISFSSERALFKVNVRQWDLNIKPFSSVKLSL